MLVVSWWSLISISRRGSFSRFHLQILATMTFSGWVAVLAGWFVTEIGRQPWIVYNLIRTEEVVAEHGAGMVLGTLLAYLTLYLFLMVSYIGALLYLSSKPAPALDNSPLPETDNMERG